MAVMHNFFEAKGQKLEAHRTKSVWWGFWKGDSEYLSPPAARGLWERCKLPHWGLGPSRKHISVYFELKNRIWRQLFRLFISAEKKWK